MNVHEAFWLPHDAPVVGNVAALVAAQGPALPDRRRAPGGSGRCPTRASCILGEGELRDTLERQVQEHHLEKHVLLPGFRTDVLGCIKSFDLFVMSSVTEGLGTSLLDAMACSRPIVATTPAAFPKSSRRRDRPAGAAARSAGAGADAIVATAEGSPPQTADGRSRPRPRGAERSPSNGWSPRLPRVYGRVAGRRP